MWHMVDMDTVIRKTDECADLAESLGFGEDAAISREAAQVCRELVDDFKRAGVEIET